MSCCALSWHAPDAVELQALSDKEKMEEAARASEDCPQQIQSGLALALDGERIVKQGSLWLLNRK